MRIAIEIRRDSGVPVGSPGRRLEGSRGAWMDLDRLGGRMVT
jgi:hypothetical protein